MSNRIYPKDNPTDVLLQDNTSNPLSIYMHKHIGDITLASNTAIGDTTITLESGHGTQVGELICFKESARYTQAGVVNVATNVITLDSPLDFAYTVAGSCSRTTKEANVDGSTAQIFHVKPQIGVSWDITRIALIIEDATDMDSSRFGGITGLTKGIVLRRKDGTYKNIMNVKSNGEFVLRSFDLTYYSKAPAGVYGLRAVKSFTDGHGIVVRLNGNKDDEFEFIIQDDLTGLTKFNIVLQGHTVVP